MLAVDEQGELVDGDEIIAILALDLGVDLVAVTQMTNLGFHALMRGARDPRRHDRRRRPLRARGAPPRRRRARRRAVRSRDLPARPRHRRRARRRRCCSAPPCAAARSARPPRSSRATRSARRTSASPRSSSPRRYATAVERDERRARRERARPRPSLRAPSRSSACSSRHENGELAAEACATIAALVESELG